MYKKDDKGNRIFLSSAEIDAARLEARSTRDLACGPVAVTARRRRREPVSAPPPRCCLISARRAPCSWCC